MDDKTADLVWRLRDRAKNAHLVNEKSDLAKDLFEAAQTIERLHKEAYFAIPIPRFLRRKSR